MSINNKTSTFKWETSIPKSSFPTNQKFPYRISERDKLADLMSVQQILDTSELVEDSHARRKRKWKEIRQLWSICRLPEYRKKSIENALWHYGHRGITVDHFIMALTAEFDFGNCLKMDSHLRWLYWSFEGGAKNKVDWRDILASFKIIIFFRLVQNRTAELLVILFDIYAEGGSDPNAQPNDEWYITARAGILSRIFHLTCETNDEVAIIGMALEDLLLKLEENHTRRVSRRAFKNFLRSNPALVNTWRLISWERLPSELRLQVLDEAQREAQDNADVILFKYKSKQAYEMYVKHTLRVVFKDWTIATTLGTRIRKCIDKKLAKYRRVFFRFWRNYAAFIIKKRRRRLLAEVMGNYTIKARTFARIKLFNYTYRRVGVHVCLHVILWGAHYCLVVVLTRICLCSKRVFVGSMAFPAKHNVNCKIHLFCFLVMGYNVAV